MDDEDHAFILMMHHIVCDSASLGILWREVATLYEADVKGEASPLPPLPIQYGDYAVWQRAAYASKSALPRISPSGKKNCGARRRCWTSQPIGSAPPFFRFAAIKRQFAFDAALAKDLRALCRQHQASLFTVFAAALNTVMHRYTGQDDILIGIPIAARERPECGR